MLTLEKFEEASEVVKQVTTPTKLVYSEYLSAQTGARIYLKPENMQHTERISCAEPTTRSARCQKKTEIKG